MNTLNILPQELADLVFEQLSREDVIALRHTDRGLATKPQGCFNNAFESLTVTCSKAGLQRLEQFVSDPHCQYFLPKVKKITIHSLTPYRLRELADSLPSQTKVEEQYLQAYVYMRKTLINSLNALPNLQNVTVTDLPFRGVVDPPAQWSWDTSFDPLFEHLGVYGLEAVLSIFSDLKARDSMVINLVTNLFGRGFPLLGLGHMDDLQSMVYKQMFGLLDLQESIIYEQCQLDLTVVGDDSQVYYEYPPPGLFGIHATIARASGALRSLTIKRIPKRNLRDTLTGFFTQRGGNAVIPYISIEDTEITEWPRYLFPRNGDMIKDIKFRNCETHSMQWTNILKGIENSPTVERVSIVDCKVFKRNARADPTLLASFDELGATPWDGIEEIRKGSKLIRDRIIQLCYS